MKKALSIVYATILLIALLVIPAQAAEEVRLSLPVTQEVTLEGEGAKTEDAVVDYTLTAETEGAPMPNGASGGEYSFQMIGEKEYEIPEITYRKTGTWKYVLTAEGEGVQPSRIDITVYVVDEGEGLAVRVNTTLPDGEKCELKYTVTVKTPDEPTPPGPDEPTPPGPDEPTPPGPPSTGEFRAWSLVNLICAMLTVAAGGIMVLTAGKGRRGRLLGILPAGAAMALFLLTEHMSLPMQLCDKYTPLMAGLLAINVMLIYLTQSKREGKKISD